MTGRIGRAFETAARARRGAFVPFLTSGFPEPDESDRLAAALCAEGADVLELGIPFSDPVADGPVIQRATEVALRAGATLARVLDQARELRARFQTPLVLMSYLNPILRYGPGRFAEDAVSAGVDGLILVDLPPEEDPALWSDFRGAGLDTIALVAPSTGQARLPLIAACASGFLYVVARLGVTGRGLEDPSVALLLERCREWSALPRCLGFGIGLATPLERYRGRAEGAVVGSALLETIFAGENARARDRNVRDFASRFLSRLAALAPP